MKDRKGLSGLFKFVIFAGLFLTTFIFIVWLLLTIFTKTGDVYIPDIIGQDIVTAIKTLQKQKLFVYIEREIHNAEIPKGYVVSQDPSPGSLRKRYSQVHIVLSSGPDRLVMPDFRGSGIRQVENELNRLGLQLENEIKIYSENIDPGKVIAHIPGPGEICMPGSTVDCLVSRGKKPDKFYMPDLIGKKLSDVIYDIREIADPFVRFIADTNQKPGTIIDQYPLPGYPVYKNQRIELKVASLDKKDIWHYKTHIINVPRGFLDRYLVVEEKNKNQKLILFDNRVHPGSVIRVIGLLDKGASVAYSLSYFYVR